MKNFILLLFIAVFITACSSEPQSKTVVIKTLSEEQLYDYETISRFAEQVNDSLRQKAKQEFLSAIDEYRNKKNPRGSIAVFKKSLLIYPEVKAYYEMGNAFMDLKNYSEALEAYHMAEKLDYNPISKVLYNLACAYSMSENGEVALEYIQLAIENGYANTRHLLTDPDLEFARNAPGFNETYEAAMSGASSPETAMFELFAVNFPSGSLPMQVEALESQHIDLGKYIAYDFEPYVPEMINAKFSRNVGDEFYYLAKVHETPEYTAVIYAGVQVMYSTPPIYHKLVTYSLDGKIISALEVGGYHYYDDPMKGYSISPELEIEVTEYEIAFEKDVDEYGYDDNTIAASNFLNSTKFRITDKGKIMPTNINSAWRRGLYE